MYDAGARMLKPDQAPRLFNTLFHSTYKPFTSSLMSLEHLRGLDTLRIPYWYGSEKDKQLPASITHLTVLVSSESDNLGVATRILEYLLRGRPRCSNIQSIAIRPADTEFPEIHERVAPLDRWTIESSQACFLSLHTLTLMGAKSELILLFRRLSLPSLEALSLWIYDDPDSIIEDTQRRAPPGVEVAPKMPRLSKLTVQNAKFSCSPVLALFRGRAVKSGTLHFRQWDSSLITDLEVSTTAHALSNFGTRNLELMLGGVQWTAFLLNSMNTQLLQSLNIDFSSEWESGPAPAGISRWYESNGNISLPGLTRLECGGEWNGFAKFVAHLSANLLTHLLILLTRCDSRLPDEWHPPPYAGLLPSVRDVTFYGNGPSLMVLWDLVPNVEVLHLEDLLQRCDTVTPRDKVHHWERDREISFEDLEKAPPWKYIGINPEGYAFFRRLRALVVSCAIVFNKEFGPESEDQTREDISQDILELLKLRHQCGAVPLTLDKLPEISMNPSFYDELPWCNVNFSAHYRPDARSPSE